MLKRLISGVLTLVIVLGVLVIGLFVANRQGWLSVFGERSESHDTQVIQAIERTEEVSLLSLHVQGIADEDRRRVVLGREVPGTSKKVFLKYEFDAKLGLDGSQVEVEQTGENAYRITLPEFIFIGYAEPTFAVAAQDGGILSWVTQDVDQLEMVNRILSAQAQQEYLESNEALLREQAESFYDTLIKSVVPTATTEFVFSS